MNKAPCWMHASSHETAALPPAQCREVALGFRRLSRALMQYRHTHLANLDLAEIYRIENTEWTLINHCTAFSETGIPLSAQDPQHLHHTLMRGMQNAMVEIKASPPHKTVSAIGCWSLHLGAAMARGHLQKVRCLLAKEPATYNPHCTMEPSHPHLARAIGLNFAKASDLLLSFHHTHAHRLSPEQKRALQTMEITLLNFNSNFGGLGIRLPKGPSAALMQKILARSEGLVAAMGQGGSSYYTMNQLGQRMIALGSAITEESEEVLRRLLLERSDPKQGPQPPPLEPPFRKMAFSILKYRYAHWDTLTQRQRYALENLEFSLTNFNSNFTIFGITPQGESATEALAHDAIFQISKTLTGEGLAFSEFFASGKRGLKLGAALLTQNGELVAHMAFPHMGAEDENPGNPSQCRDLALALRSLADTLLGKRFEAWESFSAGEAAHLENIQWTLMNFASNLAIFGIHMKKEKARFLLPQATATIQNIHGSAARLTATSWAQRRRVLKLGMNAMALGATLTTEDAGAIASLLISHGGAPRKLWSVFPNPRGVKIPEIHLGPSTEEDLNDSAPKPHGVDARR